MSALTVREGLPGRTVMASMLCWVVIFFMLTIFSVFLHENGHGIGAKLDGIHVSTGFNQVGESGKSPKDADFRSSGYKSSFISGILGPLTTWILAIIFTFWLYRFNILSLEAMTVGMMAIVNGFIRAEPMVQVLVSNLRGAPRLEDEVGWGIWAVLNYCRPLPESALAENHILLSQFPQLFLREPVFWLFPLVSLLVSVTCLILACRKVYRLWVPTIKPVYAGLLGLSVLPVYFVTLPVLTLLDRLIRINW